MSNNKNLIDKYIKNTEVHKARYYFSDKFEVSSGVGDVWEPATLDIDIIKKTSNYHQLGNDEVRCPPGAREWVYNSFITPTNILVGDGSNPLGGYKKTPQSREEAYEMLKELIVNHYKLEGLENWESLPGIFTWQHYSCEWEGCGSIGSEIGCNIPSTQTHTAFCRGAARQYGLPWCEQFSFWTNGTICDFTGDHIWGPGRRSAPTGGVSKSFYKRAFVAAYLGGASHFYPEACVVINYTKEIDENGHYKLSPVGETSKQLNKFVRENPDIGINYTPFAIVLDFYHGMFPGDRDLAPKKSFNTFDYNSGDDMTYELFNKFFPGSWVVFGSNETCSYISNVHSEKYPGLWEKFGANQATFMVNGPYGDTCDVLLQNASQEVLDSYPCLILSGSIKLSDEEANRYMEYVNKGGTLILNTAYFKFFPEWGMEYNGRRRCDIPYGKGKVIAYGADYRLEMLDGIIKEQLARFIPFSFSEDVEYLVNVKENSLILTVINNNGHYRNRYTGDDVDASATMELTLEYTGEGEISEVKELWNNEKLPTSRKQTVVIEPGDLKVIEFKF